ncbi:hypothetical protein FQA39_LY19331 [Lamprigera yunnana]|nr:hypothetical protein FQA39_LY19331 [Lamprigera yunnana]
MVAAQNAALADKTSKQIAASVKAAEAIPAPFDQAIQGERNADARNKIQTTIDSLTQQSKDLVEAANPLHHAVEPGSARIVEELAAPTHARAPGLLIAASAMQPVQIMHQQSVPTRAHGMCCLPDGSIVFGQRPPGDWLVRLHAEGSKQQAQWQWIESDRCFNGHVIASADGRHLYTTETDLENSQGLIGVRDINSMEKVAEWRTGGMDPHQLLLDGAGQIIVANGGIPTQPETGRRKLKLAHMDSSIARLIPCAQGEIAQTWKLQDPSEPGGQPVRGLLYCMRPRSTMAGIALQAEHDNPIDRQAAPVLAIWMAKPA